MEWTIPIHTFDPAKARVGAITKSQKPMAPLSYVDGALRFSTLSILLPHLTIKSYEADTGRLALSLQGLPSISTKLTALQNAMVHAAASNHRGWFPTERERTYEELSNSFQPLVSHGCIHLYCPLSGAGSFNEIQVYSGGEWSRSGVSASMFAVGKQVRVAVRLQGISFHQHPVTKMWTGKSRVQHRVLAAFMD